MKLSMLIKQLLEVEEEYKTDDLIVKVNTDDYDVHYVAVNFEGGKPTNVEIGTLKK